MIGSKPRWKSGGQAEQEAQRRADHERQGVALGHQHQRVPGEAQDALVQLAALLERLHHVRLAHLPGLGRRGQVLGPRPAAGAPGQKDAGAPERSASRRWNSLTFQAFMSPKLPRVPRAETAGKWRISQQAARQQAPEARVAVPRRSPWPASRPSTATVSRTHCRETSRTRPVVTAWRTVACCPRRAARASCAVMNASPPPTARPLARSSSTRGSGRGGGPDSTRPSVTPKKPSWQGQCSRRSAVLIEDRAAQVRAPLSEGDEGVGIEADQDAGLRGLGVEEDAPVSDRQVADRGDLDHGPGAVATGAGRSSRSAPRWPRRTRTTPTPGTGRTRGA